MIKRTIKTGRGGMGCEVCPKLHWIERGQAYFRYHNPDTGVMIFGCARTTSDQMIRLARRSRQQHETWMEWREGTHKITSEEFTKELYENMERYFATVSDERFLIDLITCGAMADFEKRDMAVNRMLGKDQDSHGQK